MYEDTIKKVYDYCIELDWFTALIYTGLIITIFFAWKMETSDLYGKGDPGKKVHKTGCGASYYKGRIKDTDDWSTILRKIRISARHDVSSVYWRRSIIFASIVSFVLLTCVLQRFPYGLELVVSVLILYLAIYFFLVYYQDTVSKHAVKQVEDATKYLEKYFQKCPKH